MLTSPLALIAGLSTSPAHADDPPFSRNTFGSGGFVEMPSARMAPDGELSISGSYFDKNQRYAFGFQIFPWLEGSFRYAGLQNFDPAYPVYYDRSFALKARLWNEGDFLPSLAVGVNDLVGTGKYGSEYIVASKQFGDVDVAVGMGWGRLGSANTLRNPLGTISNSFYTRGGSTGLGGDFNFNYYFHGPTAGVFGGVNWRTPLRGLTLSADYSSDDYTQERASGNFVPHSRFNVDASYDITDYLNFRVGYLYGESLFGGLTLHLDPTRDENPQKVGSDPPPPPAIRSIEQRAQAIQALGGRTSAQRLADTAGLVDALWQQPGVRNIDLNGETLVITASGDAAAQCRLALRALQTYDVSVRSVTVVTGNRPAASCSMAARAAAPAPSLPTEWTTRLLPASDIMTINAAGSVGRSSADARKAIMAAVLKQSIRVVALQLTSSEALLYYENYHYFREADVLERLTAILMREAPPGIERFRFINVVDGVPEREFEVLRAPQERLYDIAGKLNVFPSEDGVSVNPAPRSNPLLSAKSAGLYPGLTWSLEPNLRQELFDPAQPFGVQLVAALDGTLQLFPGFSLTGEVEASLLQNINTARLSDSVLPHVRTDQNLYFAKGKTGIGQLAAAYQFRIAPSLFALTRVGYLESSFAGAGGEILWRPEGSRWALGVDAYEVWQRDFNRLFGLQSYHVFTGHVSAYYTLPWYNINFVLRAGQYLAGDRGLTFEVTRRFFTGVEIGAFMTKTNVSAQRFGEGSFDKGIIIRMPLSWLLPFETQGQYGLELRPVQRDGGQRLYGDTQLYEITRRASDAELYNVREGYTPE